MSNSAVSKIDTLRAQAADCALEASTLVELVKSTVAAAVQVTQANADAHQRIASDLNSIVSANVSASEDLVQKTVNLHENKMDLSEIKRRVVELDRAVAEFEHLADRLLDGEENLSFWKKLIQ